MHRILLDQEFLELLLLDSLSEIIGAKGGGKPDFAQAGGPASNKLDEILISAEKILTEI